MTLYRMFDWGDYKDGYGAFAFDRWERLNPAQGDYNWSIIDQWLDKNAGKACAFSIATHLSAMEGWESFYDATPVWVYDGMARPTMNGRPVGKTVTASVSGTVKTAAMPYYNDQSRWWKALQAFTMAFGARYDKDERLTAVFFGPGLDMETQPSKAPFSDANQGYRFGQLCPEYARWYKAAFPTKPIFYACAPGTGRLELAKLCATLGCGVKHNGLQQDMDSWDGYDNFVGSWDYMEWAVQNGVPTWVESAHGYLSDRNRYWAKFSALHYHPAGVDIHSGLMDKFSAEELGFIRAHVGVTAETTPGCWIVLRDSLYPKDEWTQGGQPAGCSGHVGNWEFYMTMDMADSDAKRVENKGPGAAFESRQSRLVKEGYFSIDPGAREGPYELSIRALAGPGRGSLRVEWTDGVTIVAKDLSLEAAEEQWKTVTATIEGREFGLMSDGGAYVHMVYAKPVNVEPEPEPPTPPDPPEPPVDPVDWAGMTALLDTATDYLRSAQIALAESERLMAELKARMAAEQGSTTEDTEETEKRGGNGR